MASEAAATALMLLSTPPRSVAVAMPLKKRFKLDDYSSSQETCVPEADIEQKEANADTTSTE